MIYCVVPQALADDLYTGSPTTTATTPTSR